MAEGVIPARDTIVRRSESVLHSDLGDQIVMMNLETGEYYDIDSVGAHIWEELAVPRSIGALCEKLLTEFMVDEQTCEVEVISFVRELAELGALEYVD